MMPFLAIVGILMIVFSRPLFSRKSFEWWSSKFWGESTKGFSYVYSRYIYGVKSLSLGILFTSVSIAFYLKASELVVSLILLTEGLVITIFATLLYFNNDLTKKLMNFSWSGDEPLNDERYHIISLFVIGFSLIFFAYVFRPLNFYF